MHKVNLISFPSNSPGKACAVFKLYLGVRCQLKKKLTIDTRVRIVYGGVPLPVRMCARADVSLLCLGIGWTD